MDALSSRQVRNVVFLALGWSMAVAALFIVVSSGIAFSQEVKGNQLATLPVGILVSVATVSTLVAPHVIKYISRRCLFMTASILGALGAGLMSYAVYLDNFAVFTVAAAPQGIAYGIANLYRFYATDTTLPKHREKALSAVVGGAVLSAFTGPEASRHVRDLLTPNFLGAFLLAAGLWLLQLVLIMAVDYRLPKHIAAHIKRQQAAKKAKAQDLAPIYTESTIMSPVKREEPEENDSRVDIQNPLFKDAHDQHFESLGIAAAQHDSAVASFQGASSLEAPEGMEDVFREVSWLQIATRPGFIVGAAIACLSFFNMAGLMSATPLAMEEAGFSVDAFTLVIEAHIVAMYLPSLFSGHLVRSFGAPIMIVAGSVLLACGNAFFFLSQERFVFWVSLISIGLGWNFCYVGASNELLDSLHFPAEKGAAQAMFDFVALSGLSIAMVSAGFTFAAVGWQGMYMVYLGISGLTVLAAVLYALKRVLQSPLHAYEGDGANGAK